MATIRTSGYLEEEKKIGRKYAGLMKTAFKQQISPLQKQSGKLQKVGSRVRVRGGEVRSIAVRTVNYAFVNHFGVDKNRKAHQFKTKSGKMSKRKEHPFKLNPKIQTLEIPDNIVEGFATEMAEIRGDEFLVDSTKFLINKK